jgi:hypothetical protein
LLSQHSAETVGLYYGGETELETLIERLQEQDISKIWERRDSRFHVIRQKEVIIFFREATDKRKQYIASLMHSLFILHLTQLDPTCAAIIRSKIPGGVIYLDTNFIFRLVGLQGPDLFLASRRLVEISQELGYRLVFSPKTKAEYDYTLEKSLRQMNGQPPLTSELATLALQATSDEDFHTAYWRKVAESGTYIDPRTFYEYFQHLEVILEEHNVKLDPTFHDDIEAKDAEIATEASRLRSMMEDKFGFAVSDRTSQHVLDHDVYHRILIMQRRDNVGKESFVDVKSWFLTCDTKLPLYDRIARRGSDEKLPFCVLSGQWLQTLRPFIKHQEGLDQAQVDVLVSPYLRAYQRPPARLINNIVSRLSMSSTYSVGAASAMLSSQQFTEQYAAAENDEAQQDLIDNFYAAYADEVEKKLEATTADLARVNAEREEFASKAEKETITRTDLEGRLTETRQSLEQEKIGKGEIQKSFVSAKQEIGQQHDQITKLEAIRRAERRTYEARIKRLEERNKGISIIFAGILWGAYSLFRQPDIVELFGSIALISYCLLFISLNIWRSKNGITIAFILPALFLLSLVVPEKIADALQTVEIFLAIVVSAYALADRRSAGDKD